MRLRKHRASREKAADGVQDLRQLQKKVSVLGVCFLLQAASIAALVWKYFRMVHALGLVSEILRLLCLRFELLAQALDSIGQIIPAA